MSSTPHLDVGATGSGSADGGADDFWAQFPAGGQRELVRAAFERFAAVGFAATTTRDIASTAGLSPAAMYVHFPSKAALLAALSRAGHRAASEVIDTALAADTPRLARLADTIASFAAWHAHHPRIARVVQYELAHLDPDAYADVAALRRGMQGRIAEEIAELVACGEADVPDVNGVARALLSLCIDVCRWFDPSGASTPEEIGHLYRQLALRCLAPAHVA
jgi:AcrR family transcriptional regulator